jgi:hypothetical protein
MDDKTDGWMDGKLHEKQPRRPLLYVIDKCTEFRVQGLFNPYFITSYLSCSLLAFGWQRMSP